MDTTHPVTAGPVAELARTLHRARPDACAIVLFGSHARGAATDASDVDIMVIVPTIQHFRRESADLYRAKAKLSTRADIVLVDRQTFLEWRDEFGSLCRAADRDGVLLAGAVPR